MSEDYLDVAEQRMAEFQRRFLREVPFSARAFVDEVLGELGVAIWQLRMMREDLERAERVGARERMPPGEREAYFEAMVENAPDMVTVLDADGCIRFESRGVEAQLGYRQDELVGRSAFDLIHPDDHPGAAAALERSRAAPASTIAARYRFRHRDGSWRRLESVARFVADPGWFVVHTRAAGSAPLE